MSSCTTITCNNCRLYDDAHSIFASGWVFMSTQEKKRLLVIRKIWEFGRKEMKCSNYSLVSSLFAKEPIF